MCEWRERVTRPASCCVTMIEGNLANKSTQDSTGTDLAPQASGAVAVDGKRRGARAMLFGAYTFLVLWGMAYLVLFFTDRLPF